MNVLVTGGAGFIGAHSVRALLARGDRVTVLDNLATGRRERLAGLVPRFLEGDLRDAAAVERALEGVSHVLHLAALPSVARSVEDPLGSNDVNVTGTLVLLDACRKRGVARVVVASSSSVYGDQPRPGPKHEDMVPLPASPYAVSKLATECYALAFARSYGLEALALRYFNVFGPLQDPGSPYAAVIVRFVSAALAGRPAVVFGDGEQTRDFTYIDDVVRANVLALDARGLSGEAFNVAGGAAVSVNAMAEELGKQLGGKLELVHEAPRAGDVRHSLADLTRSRARLGYAPAVDFAEGLRRTVHSLRAAGSAL